MAGPRRPSASSVCCAANSITVRDCPGPKHLSPERTTSVTHFCGGRGRGKTGHNQHQPAAAEGPTGSGTNKSGREAAKPDRALPFPGPGAAARTRTALSWSIVGPSRGTRRSLSDVGWQSHLDGTRSEADSQFRALHCRETWWARVTHAAAGCSQKISTVHRKNGPGEHRRTQPHYTPPDDRPSRLDHDVRPNTRKESKQGWPRHI